MTEALATVLYTTPKPGIARIVLNRPGQGNAQNTQMTYDLNSALMRAAHDDSVKVIIIGSDSKHFSTGHDLKDHDHDAVVAANPPMGVYGDVDTGTVAGYYAWEREVYLDACRRWRSIPKPVIAEVRGACFGGGLMLAWVSDIIIASADAFFSDPVINIGANGVEFFAHTWELGARKAKEMLFTADSWTAAEAKESGMVNHVVAREELEDFTMAMAEKIAAKPAFALKMAKESVNASIDSQGQTDAIDKAFLFHQLCHAHNRVEFGGVLDPRGLPATVLKAGNLSKLVIGNYKPED
ncbi:enoyl-CoA hydratase [Novosphingobium sp.]|uniref:enoyl-CoA hydratase n=1 Tax=Novosphingobium sp. TaxID=1874826 RepID=UPI00286E9A67|nr:enoyl-CoA hydratase [Novosphingobium sp.]